MRSPDIDAARYRTETNRKLRQLAKFTMAEPLSRSLHALSDTTRRAILVLLQTRERTAGEIATYFPITAPSISHHLAVLKSAGLVQAERRGQRILYTQNATVLHAVLADLHALFNAGNADEQDCSKRD
jgi:DNA-binding transcriptional ArsR family regulator